jgi:transposase
MNSIDYIGFDIHKKTISFCAKAQDRRIPDEGTIPARRTDLSAWAERRSRPRWGAMEATLITGWVYDHLKPLAQKLKVAPGDAQGDHRIQEEERQSGCTQDR